MSVICFASQKGSPGTTLTALSVAATWPSQEGRRRVFVEADPFGGVLALRYQLSLEPGLVTLAAAIRGGITSDEIWNHAQSLPGGLVTIVGPDRPDQANSVLAATGRKLGEWFFDLEDTDVIVDVGRIASDSPLLELLASADIVVMVARPTAEQLQPAAQRLVSLGLEPSQVGWALIGERPHGATEVEKAFGINVFGVIADDSRAAHALEQGGTGGQLRRSALARSAGALAETLAQQVQLLQVTAVSEPALPDEPAEFADFAASRGSNNGN